jgi:hypothetical protein
MIGRATVFRVDLLIDSRNSQAKTTTKKSFGTDEYIGKWKGGRDTVGNSTVELWRVRFPISMK